MLLEYGTFDVRTTAQTEEIYKQRSQTEHLKFEIQTAINYTREK